MKSTKKIATDIICTYEKLNLTKEMFDWFVKRTNMHIELVNKYARLIERDFSCFIGLKEIAEKHDESKFKEPELTPYVYIAWDYHMKDLKKEFVVPKIIKEKMNEATLHHVKNNSHHPEFHDKSSSINKNDRDKKPEQIVNALYMPIICIGEMLADWFAMSEEKGNTVKEWADKNVNVRWKFSEENHELIYQVINHFEI